MRLYLTALNPTDAVLEGFLPAAARLGLPVTVLTDQPGQWPEVTARVSGCDVRSAVAVVAAVRGGDPATALLSNSDHLQTATALAAGLLGLPGKDPGATRRCKDKLLTRRTVAAAGLDRVTVVALRPDDDVAMATGDLGWPAVVKPRQGVASEDVYLVADPADLAARVADVRARRPGQALLVEEYLPGALHTLETLGDAHGFAVTGGWRTGLGPPPTFAEDSHDWAPAPPATALADLRAQLTALGVGLGACHTEYVLHHGRARLVEVNYRLLGDRLDLILADLLEVPLFEYVIRLHTGEPLAALGLPDPAAIRRWARVEYVRAQVTGTLVSAPGALTTRVGDVPVRCRPLRPLGTHAPLTGTNRDYLAVLDATGTDPDKVRAALRDVRAGQRWEVRP